MFHFKIFLVYLPQPPHHLVLYTQFPLHVKPATHIPFKYSHLKSIPSNIRCPNPCKKTVTIRIIHVSHDIINLNKITTQPHSTSIRLPFFLQPI